MGSDKKISRSFENNHERTYEREEAVEMYFVPKYFVPRYCGKYITAISSRCNQHFVGVGVGKGLKSRSRGRSKNMKGKESRKIRSSNSENRKIRSRNSENRKKIRSRIRKRNM